MRCANLSILWTACAMALPAQTTGGATMSVGALGVVPTQAASALTTSTGAFFSIAVPFRTSRALALHVGVRANQLRDSVAIAQSVLEIGTELRQRLAGGRTTSTPDFGFVMGAGVARVTSGARAATNPMAHAGFSVAWPFSEAIGLDLRAAAFTENRAADLTERSPVLGTARAWTLGARIGLSLWLRQTTRARRIPVSTLPDVTELPISVKSYQGQLLALDSAAANEAAQSRALAGDPDASSGGTVPAPYLRRVPVTADTMTHTKAGARGGGAAVDSQVVLSATSGAPPVTAVPSATPPAAQPSAATLPRASSRRGIDTAWVDLTTAAPRADTAPTLDAGHTASPPPLAATVRDSVETYQDSAGVYLGIIPTLVDGHVTPATRERLHALVEGQRAAAVPATYLLLVSAPTSWQADALLDEALSVRAWLVADGIPTAQIAVRQIPTPEKTSAEFRIIVHGQAAASATKRGK